MYNPTHLFSACVHLHGAFGRDRLQNGLYSYRKDWDDHLHIYRLLRRTVQIHRRDLLLLRRHHEER